MYTIRFGSALLCSLAVWAASTRARDIAVTPDRESGVYVVGETAGWTFEWLGDTPPQPADYEVQKGGLTIIQSGRLPFSNGVARLEYAFSDPGAVRIEATWQDDEDVHEIAGGAVCAPGEIRLSAPGPSDFDAFWEAKLAALAVPRRAARFPRC